ncbi:MFS transporter [Streptomyces sp. NPDC006372]|uniref:MFS transporter n=1 Tax=Streptomyces sp. NPDC006372 TaxID=3155599 RepID=UPI0033A4A328
MTEKTGAHEEDAGDQRESPGVWTAFRESSLAVKAVLAGVFINRVGGFLQIFLVLYLTAEGYSSKDAALALGVYGAGAVVGVLIGGLLADRLGARNATVLSMTSTAVLVVSVLYLPTYETVLAAVALCGLASQIYRPASAALMANLTPDDQQIMVFAMYRFALNVGAIAAPLVGFGLYRVNGGSYTLLFWGEALIALGYAAFARMALSTAEARASGTKPEERPSGESTPQRTALLRDYRFGVYLFAALFGSIVYAQTQSTLPLEVSAEGINIFWYTLAVSVNGLIVIACELPLTKISQYWRYRVTVGLSYGLIATGIALYGLPLGPAVIICGTVVWTMGEIIGGPAVFSYPAVASPPRLRGQYIGSFQFMWALGAAVGPVIGGILLGKIGHSVWPVMAGFAVLSTVLGVWSVDESKKSAPEDKAVSEDTELPR